MQSAIKKLVTSASLFHQAESVKVEVRSARFLATTVTDPISSLKRLGLPAAIGLGAFSAGVAAMRLHNRKFKASRKPAEQLAIRDSLAEETADVSGRIVAADAQNSALTANDKAPATNVQQDAEEESPVEYFDQPRFDDSYYKQRSREFDQDLYAMEQAFGAKERYVRAGLAFHHAYQDYMESLLAGASTSVSQSLKVTYMNSLYEKNTAEEVSDQYEKMLSADSQVRQVLKDLNNKFDQLLTPIRIQSEKIKMKLVRKYYEQGYYGKAREFLELSRLRSVLKDIFINIRDGLGAQKLKDLRAEFEIVYKNDMESLLRREQTDPATTPAHDL
jgi:hypothetical protein